MATKPASVPIKMPWIIMTVTDNQPELSTALARPDKISALSWIEAQRSSGNHSEFALFSPNSGHESDIKNKVSWEAFNG